MKQINYRGTKVEVEDWVNYIATDKSGQVWGFEGEPVKSACVWGESDGRFIYICDDKSWEQSLEKV